MVSGDWVDLAVDSDCHDHESHAEQLCETRDLLEDYDADASRRCGQEGDHQSVGCSCESSHGELIEHVRDH